MSTYSKDLVICKLRIIDLWVLACVAKTCAGVGVRTAVLGDVRLCLQPCTPPVHLHGTPLLSVCELACTQDEPARTPPAASEKAKLTLSIPSARPSKSSSAIRTFEDRDTRGARLEERGRIESATSKQVYVAFVRCHLCGSCTYATSLCDGWSKRHILLWGYPPFD
jgi:hypothetical protein